MSRTRTARIVSAAAVFSVCLGVVSAAPAMAGDDEVIKRGNCSGSTDWKLKTKTDDGRLEVEGEVDSNVNGQNWNWRILHNGNVAARGSSTTHAPSGSFEVERRVSNAPGADRIGFRATNPRSGETCRGALTF